MSFSRLWGFFKPKDYELIHTDEHTPAIALSEIHTTSDFVTIEEEIPLVENNEDMISAWQVVTSLCSVVFAPENRPHIIAATVLTTINTALNYVAPYLLGKMVDSNDRNVMGYEVDTVTLTLMLIAVGTVNQMLPSIRDRMLAPVSANNIRKMVTSVAEHQLNESADYHATTPFGKQVFLLQKGFSSAQTGIPFINTIGAMLEIGMAISILSYRFGFSMGAGIAGTATLYTGYTWFTTPSIINVREEQRKKGNLAWEKIMHVFKQYPNIHAFGQRDYEMKALHKAVTDIAQAEIDSAATAFKIGQGHIAIPRVGMLMACLSVAQGLTEKTLTLQDFILILTYLEKLAMLVPAIGKALNDLFAAWPDLKFVFNELSKPSGLTDPYPHVALNTNGQAPSIRFENVTFGYPNKPDIFRNLSFTIESGQTAAFVSQSGGGKSTIFKLLFRSNIPRSGKIYVNDQDISTVSLTSLRKNIGMISQNPNLFNGSIRDNIRYGAENPDNVTDEKIWELAERAHLTDFLKSLDRGYHIELTSAKPKNITEESKIYVYLEKNVPMYALKLSSKLHPRGGILHGRIASESKNHDCETLSGNYFQLLQDFPFPVVDKESKDKLLDLLLERKQISEKRLDNSVGEDGKALSGGEQQRVAILRGLLKPSPIRAFDEITSALDGMTAEHVLAGANEITQGQTKLTITHKLLTEAQFADTIIFIHKGTVWAQGPHEELLKSCALYKELCDAQAVNSAPIPRMGR